MNDPKAAAAYHPGDGRVTRADLDVLSEELRQGAIDLDGVYAWSVTMAQASAALADERVRAAQAEAKVNAVENLRDSWKRNGEHPYFWIALNRALFVDIRRCPSCRHAMHDSRGCLNMASDNDCACTHVDAPTTEQ